MDEAPEPGMENGPLSLRSSSKTVRIFSMTRSRRAPSCLLTKLPLMMTFLRIRAIQGCWTTGP